MTKLSEKQTEEIKSLVESLFWTGMDADSFIDRIESIIYPNGEGYGDKQSIISGILTIVITHLKMSI